MGSVCPVASLVTLRLCRVHQYRQKGHVAVPPANTGEGGATGGLYVAVREIVRLLEEVGGRLAANRAVPNKNDGGHGGNGGSHANTLAKRRRHATLGELGS